MSKKEIKISDIKNDYNNFEKLNKVYFRLRYKKSLLTD
jgi:hypothetical protein